MSFLWKIIIADAKWTALAVGVLLIVGYIGGLIADKIAARRAAAEKPFFVPMPPPGYNSGNVKKNIKKKHKA